MNKLLYRLIRTELIIGLFISLIIVPIFNFKVGSVFFFGIIVSLLNFIINLFSMNNLLEKKRSLLIMGSFLRVLIIALLVIPFKNDIKLAIGYLTGLITHYFCLMYVTISQKGSA